MTLRREHFYTVLRCVDKNSPKCLQHLRTANTRPIFKKYIDIFYLHIFVRRDWLTKNQYFKASSVNVTDGLGYLFTRDIVIHPLESWYKNSSRLDWEGEKVSQNPVDLFWLVCLVVVAAKKTIYFQGLFWFSCMRKKTTSGSSTPFSGFVSFFNATYLHHGWFYYHTHATHAHWMYRKNIQKWCHIKRDSRQQWK